KQLMTADLQYRSWLQLGVALELHDQARLAQPGLADDEQGPAPPFGEHRRPVVPDGVKGGRPTDHARAAAAEAGNAAPRVLTRPGDAMDGDRLTEALDGAHAQRR